MEAFRQTVILYSIPWLLLLLIFFVASCESQPAFTNEGTPGEESTGPGEKLTARRGFQDEQLLADAYYSGLFQAELSLHSKDLLVNRGAIDLAEQIYATHSRLNDSLARLASEKKVMLPAELKQGEKEIIYKSLAKSGSAYDQYYVDKLINDLRNLVNLFEKGSVKATDPGLKRFFSSHLEEIRTHLNTAKTVREKIK